MGEDFTQQEDTTVARAKLIRQARLRGVPEFFPAEPAPASTDSPSTENHEVQRAYLEQLLDCTPEALIVVDKQQQVMRVNSEFTRLFGFSAEEAIGRSVDSLIVPVDRRSETLWLRQVVTTGEKITLETKRQRKDGSLVDVFISCAPVIVGGKPVAAYRLYRDISEQKRNEEALQHSEARFRSLVQSAVYGIGWVGVSGKFLDANPALVSMLGYGTVDHLLMLESVEDVFIEASECKRLIRELRRGTRLSNVEARWRRQDGNPIVVRLSGCAVDNPKEAEQVIEIIVEDVTERRILEDQFRQAQKMEAVGRLAGGVAHDFNNLLTVIRGYTEVLLENTARDSQLHSKAEAIQQAADRATSLTRQLLAFSRKQLLELKPVDLNAIVTGLEHLMPPLIGKNIELSSRLSPDLGNARADAGQMEQVIMNLVVNAKDAMPNGGKIKIETANIVLGDEIRRVHSYIQPGPYVMLTVSDNGHGMDKETRGRIFEPFFTTKEKGKGTGLGLFTVYGIIKQSRGYIFAESEVGMGTTFRVYLPRVEEAADVQSPTQTFKATSGGSETVLLVEDEVSVRELVRETLEKKGYKVLEADKGDAALKIAAAHQGRIDILISDVVMPGMSGPELCSQLVATHPQLKVLYLSGYTEDAIVHQGVLERGTAFLQKPFSLQVLSNKVRDVLQSVN